MSNVVFWRQVFLGASLFLCGGYPIIAAEVGDLTPNVGTRSLQQDGRRVICAISDKAGPIVGANVLVKGTTIGNISDMDGRVILEGVPSNAILVVSYIGYVSQEIPLKSSQTNVRIQLVEDTQALDEVVVVGYGTQSKKDIPGSVLFFLQTLSTRLRWRLSPRLCKEKHPVCISLIPEVPAVRLRSVFVVWVLLIVQTR